MSSYNIFAKFYDRLTENAEYKVRADYVSDFFSSYNEGKMSLLDLGCGTGMIDAFLAQKGYEITGIDLSEDMLFEAVNKGINNCQFIRGDMTDFALPYKVDNCLCSLDGINHLDGINAVKKCFKCVADALNKGGIFVFDVNTVYKHNMVLDNNTFVFDEEDFFLSWDNENLGDNRVRILLDFFVFNGESYDRFSEEFVETAYEISELESILGSFDILGVYDELATEPPKFNSERIYFVCRRK